MIRSVLASARLAGGARLRASATTFLTTLAPAGAIADFGRPFGPGTVFAAVGAVPGQLAFNAAAGRVNRGASAVVAGQSYELKIRASSADGRREVAETFAFQAIAPSSEPPPPELLPDTLPDSIAADGWQAVAASPPAPNPSAADALGFYVTRQGFDGAGAATSFSERFTYVSRVRQPHPNAGSLTANNTALHDFIYATDTITGVTNSSTKASPKPVANWAVRDRQTIDGNFQPEVVAFHRNGIACVRFVATDGVTTVTADVSARVVSGAPGDRFAVLVYRPPAGWLSSLNDGLITINALVFPRVGTGDPAGANAAAAGSILRSADGTAGTRNFSPQTFRKGAVTYIRVATAGGNDATATVSTDQAAVLAGTPAATIGGAIARLRTVLGNGALHSCVIMLGAGAWANESAAFQGADGYQTTAGSMELVITKVPSAARADVTFTINANGNQLRYVTLRELTVSRSGFVYMSAANRLALVDCDFSNGQNIQLIDVPCYWQNVNVTNTGGNLLAPSVGNTQQRLIRGVNLSSGTVEGWLVLGSLLGTDNMNTGTVDPSGMIVAFNRLNSSAAVADLGISTGSGNVNGLAIVQNVFEYNGAAAGRGLLLSADGATGNLTHPIVIHNTVLGSWNAGRTNILYDDTAGTRRTHDLGLIEANIFVQLNTKADEFLSNGAALGNFWFEHGVASASNFTQFIDAGNGANGFRQFYPGRFSSIGTSSTVRNDPLFATFAAVTWNGSAYAAGTPGGSNPALQAGSPAKGIVRRPWLEFDAAGAARSALAASAGAYE